jgi:phosphatidylinositol mannoside-binding LppM-like protein
VRAIRRSAASIGLVIVMALTLSGCIHLDRNVALNGDGSGTYLLTVGISDQLLSVSGGQLTSSMDSYGDQVKKEGGSYRRYEDAGYTDWAYTRPFASIADLNKLLQEAPQTGSGASGLPSGGSTPNLDTITFSEQPGFLSNSFHVTGHMSMVVPTGSTDTGGIDVSTYLKDMRESFAVTMPGSISSHNGGVVSGNTVTYTVHYGEETDIDVTGSGLNTSTLIPLGVGAGIVLVLAGITGFIIWRRRGGSRGAPAPIYAGVHPSAPATGPTTYSDPFPSSGPAGPLAGPTDPTIPGTTPPSAPWQQQ